MLKNVTRQSHLPTVISADQKTRNVMEMRFSAICHHFIRN
jgi:hypothetical protein